MSRCPLTVLALSLVIPACSSQDDSAPSRASSEPPSNQLDGPSLAFSEWNITLAPGASHSIGVQVTPPSEASVRLSLVGESGDAFLDTGVVTTDASGAGSFTLTAPSSRASFRVRATLGTTNAELGVAVASSVTGLTVWPLYAGKRKVDSWTATVSTDGSCDDDEGVIYSDGQLVTEGFLHFPGVPAGVPLKVTVRAGQFVGGCEDTLAPTGHILDHGVLVVASDRPLQLESASLRVKLGLDSGDGWATAWSDVVDGMVDRFVAKKSDAGALLDAMYASCHPTAAPAFLAARGKGAWDIRLSAAFDSILGVGTLTKKLRSFLTAGVGANGSTALEGTLVSGASAGGKATLSLSTIGGVPAEKASLSPSIEVTWAAGTGDRVLFGGSASFQATALAAELGQAVALQQVGSASSLPAALAEVLSCEDVATVLVGSTGGEVAYGSCGALCVASLCEAALGTMWVRAVESSAAASKLELSATAAVTDLSDTARPLGFDGSWVGTTTIGGRQARVSGKAIGAAERTSVP